MSISRVLSCVLHFLSLLIPSLHHVNAQDHLVANIPSLRTNNFWLSRPSFDPASFLDVHNSVANLSSLWVNKSSADHHVSTGNKSVLVPILLRVSNHPSGFVRGFYCNYDCNGFVFAVLIFPNHNATDDSILRADELKVVWSANRNSLVGDNATLQLTEQGDLVLKEADGTTAVWSTNTCGMSVVGLNLTETGNLVPFDSNNETVWQSFDHPTDSLLRQGTWCYSTGIMSCEASHDQSFIELKDTSYISTLFYSEDATDVESCKQACLKNCSCKAAIFTKFLSFKRCSFLSEIFSLTDMAANKELLDSTVFLKVQNLPKKSKAPSPDINRPLVPPPPSNTGSEIIVILLSCFAAFFGLFLIVMTRQSLSLNRYDAREDEEDYLCQVPGLPTRFSYEVLVEATENFSQNLGKGGFACVFEGILSDGTKIAVKCLNGFAQIRDSFLAEVETIGSIHHLNLVKLIGYCASKSNKFLVYEYMCNGSLDKWLFHRNQELALDWQTRRKIILDIAKGLTYLHEECQKKIVHLDIKPQNILLDKNFNAKVSDFGLSKIMDRDQSQVVTTLRGTLGYLAPEWFSSAITEKADVYSFGVVTLEILCGRKNLDHARPEKDMHLLSLFKLKAEEGGLSDLVDKHSEDMQVHGAEVVEMMRVAA